MAAVAAAVGVRQHHHAGGGGGGSGTKGVARRGGARRVAWRRWGEGGPRSRRLETPLQGWVGQEGGKKSDKTIERNLNYAPRKMAIVCKAMLIGWGRQDKTAGADFADAARRKAVSFFFVTRISSLFFLLLSFVIPSLNLVPRRLYRFFMHLAQHFAFFTCRPIFILGCSSFAFFPSFSRFISALYLLLHVSRTVAVIWYD